MPRKIAAPIIDRLASTNFVECDLPSHMDIRVLYRCRCRCQNTVELHIQAEAVLCVKCGIKMRPQV